MLLLLDKCFIKSYHLQTQCGVFLLYLALLCGMVLQISYATDFCGIFGTDSGRCHFSFIRSNENESKRTRRFWSKASLFPSYLDRQDVYTLFLSKGSISIQGMACIQLGVPASASKVFYLHDYWKYFLVVLVLQSRARCVTFTNILILLHAVVVNIECTLVIILLQKLPLFLLLGLILFQFSKKRQKVLI